jgi:hypothetical protein
MVARRNDQIERGRVGLAEFDPQLRPQLRSVIAVPRQQVAGSRVHLAFGPTAGAEGPKAASTHLSIASAKIERAEFPVHRNRTLMGSTIAYSFSYRSSNE